MVRRGRGLSLRAEAQFRLTMPQMQRLAPSSGPLKLFLSSAALPSAIPQRRRPPCAAASTGGLRTCRRTPPVRRRQRRRPPPVPATAEVLRRVEARTLAATACVSRGWRQLAEDEHLWEAACVREWANLGFSER
ncbi:hypothetical protein ABZP36_006708 [Zizania latifolia]